MVIRLGWAAARVCAAAWAAERSSALAARQEDLAGFGEPAALRSAVQQAGTQLLFQTADLSAQRRLRDPQCGSGAAEVPVIGHHGEVPHQPEVEVDGHEGVIHARIVIAG